MRAVREDGEAVVLDLASGEMGAAHYDDAIHKLGHHGSSLAPNGARLCEAPQADPVAAVKWHLISKSAGETDLALDDFVSKLDPDKREAGEKAAKTWLAELKKPPS